MFITELEISEIGLHKHIKASLTSPMVGLMGPNGCGKSTILGFIGFLFTGITAGDPPEPQESFVRYWGREGAAPNGWGRAKFIQHGQVGEIFRQVGKSPKRWLEWGGTKYTSAKDLERVLTEILGSNRKAMTESIFIPQGALDKLFFGTDTEREVMFVKLLQLGNMEKHERIILDKLNAVTAGIQDLSLLVDNIGAQRNSAELSLAELEKDLASTRDWSGDLSKLREHKQLVAAADSEMSSLDYHTNLLAQRKTTLKALLTNSPVKFGGGPAAGSMEALAHSQLLRERQAGLQARKAAITAAQALLDKWQGLKVRITEATVKKDAAEAEALSLQGLAQQDRQGYLAIVDAITAWENAEAASVQARRDMDEANATLNNFDVTTPAPDQNVIDEADKAFLALCDEESKLLMKANTWQAVVGADVHTCPICESAFDPSTVSPERLNAVIDAQQAKHKEAQAARQLLDDTRKSQRRYHEVRAGLVGALNEAVSKFTRLENKAARPQGDKAVLQAQAEAILTAQNNIQNLESGIAGYAQEINATKAQLDAITQESLTKAMADFQLDKLPSIETDLITVAAELQAIDQIVAVVRPAEDAVVSEENAIADSKRKHKELLESVRVSRGGFSETLNGLVRDSSTPETVEADLDAKEGTRQELAGRVKQAREQADEIRKKQEELNVKLASEAGRKAIKKDLMDLKRAFERSGLPMRYVRYRFEQLAEVTRRGLADLDANFTVQSDPAQSVSFTFTRLDEPVPYTMPQNKLSGGQKVRLSTAFLMAVQKLLVPEVAFLVLDEPSLHLDPDGKESLKEMLMQLSSRLGNTQSQIWVCDHASELEPAFGSIIRIKQPTA